MAARRKSRQGEAFILRDGSSVETKSQLTKAVSSMSDEDFEYFCNDSKNDFYVWIRDCLDADLAESVRSIHTRVDFLTALKAK
jgi:hypothetical protein